MLTIEKLKEIEKSVREMLDSETKHSLLHFFKSHRLDNEYQLKRNRTKGDRRIRTNRRKLLIRKVFRKIKNKTERVRYKNLQKLQH